MKNPTDQKAVNAILSQYGMEVTTDHGGGVRAYSPNAGISYPIISENLANRHSQLGN